LKEKQTYLKNYYWLKFLNSDSSIMLFEHGMIEVFADSKDEEKKIL